jgi:hypothetical protein
MALEAGADSPKFELAKQHTALSSDNLRSRKAFAL